MLEDVPQAHGWEGSQRVTPPVEPQANLPHAARRRALITRLARPRGCADATSSCTPLAPHLPAETCGSTCRSPSAQTRRNYRKGGVQRVELPTAEYLPGPACPKNCDASSLV